jgi:hypothetical protein
MGLGVAVVGSAVVVKVHVKLEETSVAPLTVAVRTSDCFGTSTPEEPVSPMVTWLAVLLLPPQPTNAQAASRLATAAKLVLIRCHFIPTSSPTIAISLSQDEF